MMAPKQKLNKSMNSLELEEEEEEEMIKSALPQKKQMEEDNESEENDEDEYESISSETQNVPEPEMLVPNRSRRANAGTKMAQLINQQFDKDEFYTSAYGGFEEGDQDDDFESPPHSSDEEEEEIDSDFDKPEEEENDDEKLQESIEEAEHLERKKKRLKQKQMLEKNKNWAIARINRISVPENSCDPKTQRERITEAKKTAELNIASLKRFEEFELERKRRQIKNGHRRKLGGPRIKDIYKQDGRHLVELSIIPPKDEHFPRREYRVCAVTGEPARYIDPLTKLPYANKSAFKIIRGKYLDFLTMRTNFGMKGAPMSVSSSPTLFRRQKQGGLE